MKRSQNLKLVLMAAAVPLALVGCKREPTGQVLTSVEQCESLALYRSRERILRLVRRS